MAAAERARLETWTTHLVREPGPEVEGGLRIRGPEDVARILAPILDPDTADREMFVALYLNSQHEPIGWSVVTMGVLDASLIHPREVFKGAILASAAAVLVAHNHPSGDPTPSPDDRAVSRQLVEAGKALGIPLIDHVVVGTAGRVASALHDT